MSEQQYKTTDLKRNITQKQLSMIVLGGAIGGGLWFGSGRMISQIGPGGALLVVALLGLLIYLLMTSLGEMAAKVPLSGSFGTYASKFIDPAVGFVAGWSYYLSRATAITFEINVGIMALEYWFPAGMLPLGMPISLAFLLLLFGLNFASAKQFVVTEFWLASIRVIAVISFLLVGILLIFGVFGPGSPGFENWTHTATEGVLAGQSGPFPVGIGVIAGMLIMIASSFQGTELVGLAAGEAKDPETSIPKAIKFVLWRILLFYVGAVIIMGFLIPFDDPHINPFSFTSVDVPDEFAGEFTDDFSGDFTDEFPGGFEIVEFSPFTLVFAGAGFSIVAGLMNLVFLISTLSCANAGLFCATRMLYGLAKEGKAPKAFAQTSKRGVLVNALLLSAGISAFGFFSSFLPGIDLFDWLLNASGTMAMFGWVIIAWSHLRFRKAYLRQGNSLNDLTYKAKFFPVGPIVGIAFYIIAIITSEYWVFLEVPFSFVEVMVWYWPIPVFAGLFLIYKLVKKTKFVKPEEADFSAAYTVDKRP